MGGAHGAGGGAVLRRRLAWAWLGAVTAAAVAAPVLASSRPIVASIDGALCWRPGDERAAALGPRDWALWPPLADPLAVRTDGALAPLASPSAAHPLGTDDRGRDVAARLVHGARASAVIAALAALLATLIGVLVSAALTRAGPAVRAAGLAILDAIAAAPALLVAVAAGALVGARGPWSLAALIAAPRAADTARLLTAQLVAASGASHVEAARALGASPARVLVRHLAPSVVPAVGVAAAITAATAVLSEAALAFLGVGLPPPTPSWGELLAQATVHDLRWWLAVPAGLCATATAAALFALALAPARRSR